MESMKPLSREAPLRHKGPKSWPSKNGTREWQTMRFVKYDAYIIHASFWTTLYILYFVFMFLFFQSGHSSTECYFSLFLQKFCSSKNLRNSKIRRYFGIYIPASPSPKFNSYKHQPDQESALPPGKAEWDHIPTTSDVDRPSL